MKNDSSFTSWIGAARLRTLPLAIAGVLVGQVGAYYLNDSDLFRPKILVLSLFTALLLQILSNFANDYGDFKKGADHAGRIGSKRALASGSIQPNAMKIAIVLLSFITLAIGVWLLFESFGKSWSMQWFVFLVWGFVSITAAITYTTGKFAFGYRRLGDLGVLVFFGATAVIGSAYLQNPHHVLQMLIPAIWMGCLATGVLNVNNIRDMESDALANKQTFALWLGLRKARIYHVTLLSIAFVTFMVNCFQWFDYYWQFICFIAWFPILKNGIQVWFTLPGSEYNMYLKNLALGSFGVALLFCVVILLSL